MIRNAHIKSDRPFENQNRFKNTIQLCHRYQFKELKEQTILNYQLYGADIDKHMAIIEQKFELTADMQKELIELLSDKNPRNHLLIILSLKKVKLRNVIKKIMVNFSSRIYDLSHGLLNDSQIHETTAFTLLYIFMILKLIVGFSK